MAWTCVLCDVQAVAEVEAAPGVEVPLCESHLAARAQHVRDRIARLEHAFATRPRVWCAVPDCSVPTDQELCEVHRPPDRLAEAESHRAPALAG